MPVLDTGIHVVGSKDVVRPKPVMAGAGLERGADSDNA